MTRSLPRLLKEVRACEVCTDLPLGPRPIVQLGAGARIVVIGQAPGTKVHESGVPWDDASGEHLREWMAIDNEIFYDPRRIALVPMGFCYPGRRDGGDAPPRPECAPTWHDRLAAHYGPNALLLLIGQYAQEHYLGRDRKRTLTETVRTFTAYQPKYLPLPHPSWRSRNWIKKNLWFTTDVLPVLRREIQARL